MILNNFVFYFGFCAVSSQVYRCHLISLVELIGAVLQVAHQVEQEVAVVMKAIVAGGIDPISGRG
jgi:hypothetical protein